MTSVPFLERKDVTAVRRAEIYDLRHAVVTPNFSSAGGGT